MLLRSPKSVRIGPEFAWLYMTIHSQATALGFALRSNGMTRRLGNRRAKPGCNPIGLSMASWLRLGFYCPHWVPLGRIHWHRNTGLAHRQSNEEDIPLNPAKANDLRPLRSTYFRMLQPRVSNSKAEEAGYRPCDILTNLCRKGPFIDAPKAGSVGSPTLKSLVRRLLTHFDGVGGTPYLAECDTHNPCA